MTPAARRWLFWTPRVLGIAFAGFISLFALDVFEGHPPLSQALIGLAIHLIPTALLVVGLIVAWRWEWVGALLFLCLGVAFVASTRGRADWRTYAFIAGPPLLLGLLFLLNWLHRAELRRRA